MIIRGMKTLIENGWVVAWNGTTHEVHERGSVVIERLAIDHDLPMLQSRTFGDIENP